MPLSPILIESLCNLTCSLLNTKAPIIVTVSIIIIKCSPQPDLKHHHKSFIESYIISSWYQLLMTNAFSLIDFSTALLAIARRNKNYKYQVCLPWVILCLYLKGFYLWKEQLEAFLSSDSTKNGQVCRQFKYELNFTDMFYMNYMAVHFSWHELYMYNCTLYNVVQLTRFLRPSVSDIAHLIGIRAWLPLARWVHLWLSKKYWQTELYLFISS